MIEVNQVYRACAPSPSMPGEVYRRIRVVEVHPNGAEVVDADSGKRPRRVLANQLHASGLTVSGKPRRTGYALEPAMPVAAGDSAVAGALHEVEERSRARDERDALGQYGEISGYEPEGTP